MIFIPEIWIDASQPDNQDERKNLVTDGIESGISSFIVRKEDNFSTLGRIQTLYVDNSALVGNVEGKIVKIESPEQLESVIKCSKENEIIIFKESDWNVIPLENAIASLSKKSKVFAYASSESFAKMLLGVLEKGVDGIVTDSIQIAKFIHNNQTSGSLKLDSVKITKIEVLGSGDRVCVDTCSAMKPGEGMLIGSQASCLFLVQSESEVVGYVEPRPFRVNAGAIHSYILSNNGKTSYLSEIKAGSVINIVNRNGETKTVNVGRCKTEERPLILVEATDETSLYSIILQNAETVKLVSESSSISVSELKVGDVVLAKLGKGGRHFGTEVDEKISER